MPDLLDSAVKQLRDGHLVAIPTETVYGLAADAKNVLAVNQVFAAKGRPSGHPLIVHIANPTLPTMSNFESQNAWQEVLLNWSRDISPQALALAQAFWPGPLTIILPKAKNVLLEVTGGQETVGVRCPNHPLTQQLLKLFDGALVAPSANRFGRISPTTADHVRDEFPDGSILILDGGACDVGIESTIVDLSRWDSHGAVILRPGAISKAMIDEVLRNLNPGESLQPLKQGDASQPRVSGSLSAHYAPRTKLVLYDSSDIKSLNLASNAGKRVAWAHFESTNKIDCSSFSHLDEVVLPSTPDALAKSLYATLRSLDQLSVDIIYFEKLPDSEQWDAVRDRLGRASVGSGA
ncbi:MAG: L-threonylcarbamoyladenylate synthase [Polynucleobacter victoriensis]